MGILPQGCYCDCLSALLSLPFVDQFSPSRHCPDRNPENRAYGLSRWTQPRGSRTRSSNNNRYPMCQSLEQTKESRPSLTYTPCNRPENHPKPQQHFGFTRLSLIASLQICLPWHGGVDAGSDIRTLLYVDVSTFFFTRLALAHWSYVSGTSLPVQQRR